MKRKQGNKRETKVGSLFLFRHHGEGGGGGGYGSRYVWNVNLNLKHISYAWIHWKASPGESGVPMILYRHNDLRMRLPKLTASFGLLRSELMNYSQMGAVNFALRLFRVNGDTIGAITIVWKWWNTLFVSKEQGPHLHIKKAWSVCL